MPRRKRYFRVFPIELEPPEPLVRLFKFAASCKGEKFAGDFFPARQTARRFGIGKDAAQFAVFGQLRSDGSQYAYWLYEGRTLADAPIVYLGSSECDWNVMAANAEDFLALLSVGVDDLGCGAYCGDLVEEMDDPSPHFARSHAQRGNAVCDALRRPSRPT